MLWFRHSQRIRARFFDHIGDGASLAVAAQRVGVSRKTGQRWLHGTVLAAEYGMARASYVLDRFTDAGAIGTGRNLSLRERFIIQEMRLDGQSFRAIAARLGRAPSTISREVHLGSVQDDLYHGFLAHVRARVHARRPKDYKLDDHALCGRVETWMDDGWSPKLIADMLRREHPEDRSRRVSHETIYQALYVQGRGRLRQDLARCLSTKRRWRRSAGNRARGPRQYRDALTIRQRPAEVADRAVPGHWEGDLIVGPMSKSAIGTLAERSTRFTILLHLSDGHTADAVSKAMITQMSVLPDHLRRSMTWDRGTKMSNYESIQMQLQMPVYFCDPHSPWQRGTGENTNRLLRHWFEKGTDLSVWDEGELLAIAAKLNKRPRPTLDYRTPSQALSDLLTAPVAKTA